MRAISKVSEEKTRVNVLPCRINHNGPAKVVKRYWQPRDEADGANTSYFRGRKLKAKLAKLPEKYQGLVLKASDKTMIEPILPTPDDEEPELPESTKVIEQVAAFDELVVWGHDRIPSTDDHFVKGIEEWIAFAEAIHAR